MKYLKFIISLAVTILILFIARNNAMNRPSFYSATQGDYSIEYLSTPKVFEKEPYTIEVKIVGQLSETVFPVVRQIEVGQDIYNDAPQYSTLKMNLEDSLNQTYSFSGIGGLRGKKTFYYFQILDIESDAKVTLSEDKFYLSPFTLKYIGHVPLFILVGHILLIFLSVFFIILASVHAISFLRGSGSLYQVARYTLYAVIACFLGGYPFGFAMNWYAFDCVWEGVPFGTDATDNKTQLLFAYLLFAIIAMLGSLRKKEKLNLYSNKTTAKIAIGTFFVMIFVNLIPHSIQFPKSFTDIFCYAFISVVFILTIYPTIKKQIEK